MTKLQTFDAFLFWVLGIPLGILSYTLLVCVLVTLWKKFVVRGSTF